MITILFTSIKRLKDTNLTWLMALILFISLNEIKFLFLLFLMSLESQYPKFK